VQQKSNYQKKIRLCDVKSQSELNPNIPSEAVKGIQILEILQDWG